MPLTSLKDRVETLVWAPARTTGLVRLARTVLILGRDLAFGQLTLRAMGLVYTTLLSIVPLLALIAHLTGSPDPLCTNIPRGKP